MKVTNQSSWNPDMPICLTMGIRNISLTLQDAKNLAEQLREVINDIEKKQ